MLNRASINGIKSNDSNVILLKQAVNLDKTIEVTTTHIIHTPRVKFSTEGGTVRLSGDYSSDAPRVVIESRGWSIPNSALDKFFEIMSIGEAMTPGGDLGVGPALAYRILSLFGATVSVANRSPSGISLTISLKRAQSE